MSTKLIKKKIQSSRNTILLLMLALSVAVLIAWSNLLDPRLVYKIQSQIRIIEYQLNSVFRIKTSNTDLPAQPKSNLWRLVKKSNNGDEQVFSILADRSNVIQWNNYLIYSISNAWDLPATVRAYDLNTGENTVIFDESKDKVFQDKQNHDITDLMIIGNKLYFSLGGYGISGYTYWTDFPPKHQPHLLTSTS